MSADQRARKIVRARVADQIVEDLRDRILSGALPDGAKLPAERDLGVEYGVSGQTVREAIRALTAMGLVSARHGSGSYVTASGEKLVAMSLSSVIQLERLRAGEVLGILGALLAHAAHLAATRASDAELTRLRDAVERLPTERGVEETAENLKYFLRTLSAIAHNPLLAVLCRYLIDLQVGLSLGVAEKNPAIWKTRVSSLQDDRLAVVAALENRDAKGAAKLVLDYHARTLDVISPSSSRDRIEAADTQFARLVSVLPGDKEDSSYQADRKYVD